MSADGWSTCPRCLAQGEVDPGDRKQFREEYSIGFNDPDNWVDEGGKPPVVIVTYSGECQSCGLLVELNQRHPVTWEQPPNRPASANYAITAWERVPAGWFVKVPNGDAWEVVATENQGVIQVVTLRSPDGKLNTARRPAEKHVPAVAGTHAVPWDVEGTFAAFPSSQIIQDGGQS